MTYHYTIAQLSALGFTGISVNYACLAADTVSLRCPLGARMVAPVPWVEGDRVVLEGEDAAGMTRLFNGCVRRRTVALSGAAWALQVELANDVDVLERTTYAHVNAEGELCFAQSFYTPRASRESQEGERLTSCQTVCERCFDWALAGGKMDCGRAVDLSATTMGVAGSGSQSCWSLILAALRWVPDAVTAMRYAPQGDVLRFLTARSMPAVTVDVAQGCVVSEEGDVLCRFEGVAACELTPRPDLVAPVCALTGRRRLVLPEGGDVRAPGAFVYHVRARGGGLEAAAVAQRAAQVVTQMAPRQVVRGKRAPVNLETCMGEVDMKNKSAMAPGSLLAWWLSFPAFAALRQVTAGCVTFGHALFEPVPAAEAYPLPEEEAEGSGVASADLDASSDAAPANYGDPTTWSALYLLEEGSFPASVVAGRNLSGLQWCRGRLSQYVWLTPGTTLPEGADRERVLEFFAGTHAVYRDDGSKTITRYARLSVEGVWINRRRVRYAEGTNVEDGSSSAAGDDAQEEENSATADPDYAAALRDYYEATRKLYYDGSVSLYGVTGLPGALLGRSVNVAGLMPEWRQMESPCQAVSYDPVARVATLEVGSREHLSYDELLERQAVSRAQNESRLFGHALNPLDSTPDDAAGETGGEGEDEVEMIAPGVTAELTTEVGGKVLNPFEIYTEGSKVFMNGGILGSLSGPVVVPPVEITEHFAPNRRFYVRPGRTEGSFVVRYKDMEA